MPFDLDTSLLVALVIRETGTARAQAFLAANAARVLLISPWTITEFASALAPKEWVGTMSRQERQAALTRFEKFRSLRLQIVPLAAAGLKDGEAVELIEV